MASDVIIRADHLGKKYIIGHESERERYSALRDVIGRNARNLARTTVNMLRGRPTLAGDTTEEFWALKNVNFEIKRGEVVGIIGRNGAGKSTLLKIISRVTEPTEGRVTINGRVASLLEVGTGFHPELTGRENIFLNGSILGMARSEIRKKFDEIVAFAGVHKFIDTPIKRYSSGMYLRLAFSVAAHLEPDILVVDEVLAVGDMEFQKKCLGKMDEVSRREGRTVLLVSHNLTAISELADHALLLDSGRVALDGSVSDTVSTYLSTGSISTIYIRPSHKPSRAPYVRRIEVLTSDSNGVHRFGEPLEVKFWIKHDEVISKACFSFNIVNYNSQNVVHAWAYYPDYRFGREVGETLLVCRFPALRLNVGRFHLRTYLTGPPGGEVYEIIDAVCAFEVVRTDCSILWDWRPEMCAYHEQWSWNVDLSPEPRKTEVVADNLGSLN